MKALLIAATVIIAAISIALSVTVTRADAGQVCCLLGVCCPPIRNGSGALARRATN